MIAIDHSAHRRLADAAMYALGTLMGIDHPNSKAAIYFLARALKDNGIESIYVDSILSDPKYTTPNPGGGE